MKKECWNCENHGTEVCNDCFIGKVQKTPSNWKPNKRYVPDSNAERIRSMSNEELAEAIARNIVVGACMDFEKIPMKTPCPNNCKKCVLEWLSKPVEE